MQDNSEHSVDAASVQGGENLFGLKIKDGLDLNVENLRNSLFLIFDAYFRRERDF